MRSKDESESYEHLPEEFIKRFNESSKEIQAIENEEFIENSVDSEEAIKRRINQDKIVTINSKQQFINELKSGLGEEIRRNPKMIQIIKYPWYYKPLKFIKKIFNAI